MMPPWMIEEIEQEERRRQQERENLRLPVGDLAQEQEERLSETEADAPPERGVAILDISPSGSEYSI